MSGPEWAWLPSGPSYPATDDDRRTIDVVGLHLPRRASAVIVVSTFALSFDYSRTFLPDDIRALGRSPEGMWAVLVERAQDGARGRGLGA